MPRKPKTPVVHADLFLETTRRKSYQSALEWIALRPCTKDVYCTDDEDLPPTNYCESCYSRFVLNSSGVRKAFLKARREKAKT
jgi:hypothetical protein